MLDCSGENDSSHVKSHVRQLLEHVEEKTLKFLKFLEQSGQQTTKYQCILAKNKQTHTTKNTNTSSAHIYTPTSHAHIHMSIRNFLEILMVSD